MTIAIPQTLVVVLAIVVSGCAAAISTVGQGQQERVWVCHGNRNPRWQRVAAPAADAHRRHGDRVSTEAHEEGTACESERSVAVRPSLVPSLAPRRCFHRSRAGAGAAVTAGDRTLRSIQPRSDQVAHDPICGFQDR